MSVANFELSHLRQVARKTAYGDSDQVRQTRSVQPQNMARGLKLRIYEVQGLNYPFSKHGAVVTAQLIYVFSLVVHMEGKKQVFI